MNKYLWPHFEDAGNKHDSHMQPELTVNAYPNCLCETKQTQHHDIHTHTLLPKSSSRMYLRPTAILLAARCSFLGRGHCRRWREDCTVRSPGRPSFAPTPSPPAPCRLAREVRGGRYCHRRASSQRRAARRRGYWPLADGLPVVPPHRRGNTELGGRLARWQSGTSDSQGRLGGTVERRKQEDRLSKEEGRARKYHSRNGEDGRPAGIVVRMISVVMLRQQHGTEYAL